MLLRRIQRGSNCGSGFPKTLKCERVGGVLYNCAATPRAPTFATLPFHLPPRPSHFQIHIHARFRRQSPSGSKRWRLRGELRTQRRRASKPAVTRSGCRRAWGRQSSTSWDHTYPNRSRSIFRISSRYLVGGAEQSCAPARLRLVGWAAPRGAAHVVCRGYPGSYPQHHRMSLVRHAVVHACPRACPLQR